MSLYCALFWVKPLCNQIRTGYHMASDYSNFERSWSNTTYMIHKVATCDFMVLPCQHHHCQRNVNWKWYFYSTPQGSSLEVEILSISLSICLSSLLILFLFCQTLSSGESRNLSHGIRCPPSMSPMPPPLFPLNWSPLPVNWSHNEQDHLADLSSPIWFIISAVNIFTSNHIITYGV